MESRLPLFLEANCLIIKNMKKELISILFKQWIKLLTSELLKNLYFFKYFFYY